MKDTKECAGCEDNFYNGNNPLGVKQCWCVPDAKIITRYRIGLWDSMGVRKHYVEVKKPNCYKQKGVVFLKDIPSYAE